MLNSRKGDIIIRIHTAIHLAEEAVELAAFIKNIIPRAHIFGTSTSAIILGGRLLHYQCVISVTQMSEGCIRSVRIPVYKNDMQDMVPAGELCGLVKDALIRDDTRLMLAFFPDKYGDIKRFTDLGNVNSPA